MAYLTDLWVTDMNKGQVLKLENSVIKLQIPVGKTPRAICVDTNMVDVWVANMASNTVSRITNGERTKDIAVGKVPMGIAMGKNGEVWVANYGSNTISKIVNGYKVLDIPVGVGPRGICVDKNGVVWVSNFLSNSVSKVIDDVKVKDIAVGMNPYGICVDANNAVWVANSGSNTVSKLVNGEKMLDVTVGKMPYGICVDMNGTIWVTNYGSDTISKIVSGVKIEDIVVGDGPHGICVDSSNALYVSNSAGNTITKLVKEERVEDIVVCNNPIMFGDATGQQAVLVFKSQGSGGAKKVAFTDLDTALQDLINSATGGPKVVKAEEVIYDNATYPNVDLALDHLLYLAPVINTFSNNVNVVEIGSTVNDVILSFAVNKTMTAMSIDQGVGDVSGLTSKTLASLGLTTNRTWTLSATDGTNTVTKTTAVSFQNKRYSGVSAKDTLTDADIIALTGEFATSRQQSKTLNATGGKYLYFAMPSSFACDQSKFKIGGLFNSDWVKVARTFVNASGYSVSYDIFRTTNVQTGSAMAVDII